MNKTRKYLDVEVTKHNNSMFFNPLKLSEAHLIAKILADHKSIKVTLKECDATHYKMIFG